MIRVWAVHRRGVLREGIHLDDEHNIVVGEDGRGRHLVRVPVPDGAQVRDGVLVAAPAPRVAPDAVVLVSVRDHSGFRGSWELTAARPDQEWDIIASNAAAHRPPDGHGPLAREAGHDEDLFGTKLCPACVPVPPRQSAKVTVLAEGYCAQGDAGRMGGGPEYLLALRPGDAVELVSSGRLYDKPSTYRLAIEGDGTPVVSVPRQDAFSRRARATW